MLHNHPDVKPIDAFALLHGQATIIKDGLEDPKLRAKMALILHAVTEFEMHRHAIVDNLDTHYLQLVIGAYEVYHSLFKKHFKKSEYRIEATILDALLDSYVDLALQYLENVQFHAKTLLYPLFVSYFEEMIAARHAWERMAELYQINSAADAQCQLNQNVDVLLAESEESYVPETDEEPSDSYEYDSGITSKNITENDNATTEEVSSAKSDEEEYEDDAVDYAEDENDDKPSFRNLSNAASSPTLFRMWSGRSYLYHSKQSASDLNLSSDSEVETPPSPSHR